MYTEHINMDIYIYIYINNLYMYNYIHCKNSKASSEANILGATILLLVERFAN